MRLDPDLLCLKCLFERRFLHIGMWMWNPFREKNLKCSIQKGDIKIKLTNSTSIQWFSQNHLNKI